MKNNYFIEGVVVGFILSFLCIFLVVKANVIQSDKQKECEANLPRTQVCKMIWVPEEKKEK